ncbi:NAD(P)H-binding protein [Agrilactobacillus yilanensis]|uniref:NAD(P)H-binding protein n=1 Tax=Agrilactobacillus yilanensis TaxID=2485997 RepID=A0ABW4J5G5_9LACO|nr:NAD(P)H-binding protein [Agrilactobacillus yilanensis]
MTNVLIIGATGTLGRAATAVLAAEKAVKLTLFARHTAALTKTDGVQLIAGNVMNDADLDQAMQGQDVVFAALSGNLKAFANQIVAAMQRNGVSRLLFITSMGIYDEIPASVGSAGNLAHNPVLQTYRAAADVIEASDLDYTVIRPGWFTNGPVNYDVTEKGQPFGGHDVSISSIADLVKRLALDDTLYVKNSVGLNTPES